MALGARSAAGAAVCGASSFGCPATGTCIISGTHSIGSNCTLDFGTKNVELRGTFKADSLGNSYSVLAGSLVLNGGKLLSVGDGAEAGGDIAVTVPGSFAMIGTGSRIDTGAGAGGGAVIIVAGDVSIQSGAIVTDGGSTLSCGDAGDVSISASPGNIAVNGNATTISATTGGYFCGGGLVFLDAPAIDVAKGINASGGNPFGITLLALQGDALVRPGAVLNAGGRGQDADFGNDGGTVEIRAPAGAIVLDGNVDVGGSGGDGGGGDVVLDALGTISIGGDIFSIGAGTFASGGGVEIFSGESLTIAGKVNVGGGGQADGGFIDIASGGDVTLAAGEFLFADGGSFGGGSIDVRSLGTVTLLGDLLARGGNAGDGGFVDVRGCQVSLAGTADADPGTAGSPGSIDLTGGAISLASTARLEARPCPAGNCNTLKLRNGSALIDPAAFLDPLPSLVLDPALAPCCGNGTIDGLGQGVVDVGEQCDDGNVSFCDGCSRSCTLEPSPACAPDGNECTLDCSPTQGCAYKELSDVPCSDEPGGNVCTLDVCKKGICKHPPNTCNDGADCTVDSCDPVLGCQSSPQDSRCDDGTTCTTEVCDPSNGEPESGCVYTEQPDGIVCDDGDLCTTEERCQDGACVPQGEPVSCEDGDPCTWNDCSPALGCLNSEAPALCPCRVGGTNLPAGTTCADGNECTVGDVCNAGGVCLPGATCPDDGDPCTAEICYLGMCAHVDSLCPESGSCFEGQPCSDGTACTTGICQAGVCVSEPVACGDGDPCTGVEVCHDTLGCRQLSYPPVSGGECSEVLVDAFGCYRVRRSSGTPSPEPIEGVTVEDEFWTIGVDLKRPTTLCLPLNVGGSDPDAVTHQDGLTAYKGKAAQGTPKFTRRSGLQVTNALGSLTLDAKRPDSPMLPAAFSVEGAPLGLVPPDPDAFQCYRVGFTSGTAPFVPIADLPLEDVFGEYSVEVKKPTRLCNPANVNGSSPGAADHPQHLVCYQVRLTAVAPGYAPRRDVFMQDLLQSGQVDALQIREICLPSDLG